MKFNFFLCRSVCFNENLKFLTACLRTMAANSKKNFSAESEVEPGYPALRTEFPEELLGQARMLHCSVYDLNV